MNFQTETRKIEAEFAALEAELKTAKKLAADSRQRASILTDVIDSIIEARVMSNMGRTAHFEDIDYEEVYAFIDDEPDTREEDIPRRGFA